MSELPAGWQLKRLGDCLEKLKSGKFAERGWSPQCLSNPATNEDSWGVLKTTAVQMGAYEPQHNKELPTSLEPKVGLEINAGDFLVTTTGPRNRCGVVCLVKVTPKKLIFSGKILRFRANEEIVLAKWLMYLLMSPNYQEILDRMKVGTSDSSVSIGNSQVLDLEILVPPVNEQYKIVESLEEQLSRLDAGIVSLDRTQRKVLQIARASRRDLIANTLTLAGTEEGIFSDYFKPKYGKSLPKEKRSSDGRYPVVGSAGVMARTNEVLSEGPTIVIGRKGNVGQVEYFEEGCYPIDTTYYIQVTDGWDLQFLEFLLDSLELKNLDSSTATPSLRREDLESVSLVKPEIHTQKLLLNKLMTMSEGLSSIEEILSQAKRDASSLRRSLLNAAFTGQLTKEPANV